MANSTLFFPPQKVFFQNKSFTQDATFFFVAKWQNFFTKKNPNYAYG
jgi:hypothetical protein